MWTQSSLRHGEVHQIQFALAVLLFCQRLTVTKVFAVTHRHLK